MPEIETATLSYDKSVTLLGTALKPDPARVMLRPFTPAEDDEASFSLQATRVERISNRVLQLSEAQASTEVEAILADLETRHIAPEEMLRRRFNEMAAPRLSDQGIGERQKLLIGAYFVEEYSFEAAALFNPSLVLHPDQSLAGAGGVRLLLSLRAVGEGHVSSIVFRTAEFSSESGLRIEPAVDRIAAPAVEIMPVAHEDSSDVRILYRQSSDVSGTVIFPVTWQQRSGIEDLRLVRFVDEEGGQSYLGTYTAFSGTTVRQELLQTQDFLSFELKPLTGSLSATKGMALFPRRIKGNYAMLGRQDHENIWLLQSDRLLRWERGEVIVSPRWPWEFIQMGNCGAPIEIAEGWLVITHGVGAVRNYCLGVCLLDKRDPSRLIARSRTPLIRPTPEAYAGFVPNVAYSCGGIVIDRTLLLPFGVADTFTSFATIALDALLAEME